jgi:hypothetical protein
MPSIRLEVVKTIRAVSKARFPIVAIVLTHVFAVATGAVMVHAGNGFALSYRDTLVAQAQSADPVSISSQQGDNLRAALIETARTQWACVAQGVTGLTVVSPFALSAYRGWVGGIVSVDGSHTSRLNRLDQAIYYLSVLVLQLIPYSLAGGAGVNLGLAYFRPRAPYQGDRWIGYPKEAVWDLFRILLLIIPFVVVANLWEFLSPLNG